MRGDACLFVLALLVIAPSGEAEEPARKESLPAILKVLADPKRKAFPAAPEFAGITDWVQSEPLEMKKLRKKVVILHFWTNGCINCQRNYEHYREWLKEFEGKDVVMVGVHTPELAWEKNVEKIRSEAEKNGLTFPIAVDNDSETWRAWDNRIWPTVYVIDQRGRVRYAWVGELAYEGRKGAEIVSAFVKTLLEE